MDAANYVVVVSPTFCRSRPASDSLLTARNFLSLLFVAFNRKSGTQTEFSSKAFRHQRVTLKQCFAPPFKSKVSTMVTSWKGHGAAFDICPDDYRESVTKSFI